MKKKYVLVLSLILMLSCATLVNGTTYTTMDDGHHGGGWGTSTYHSTSTKVCEVSVHSIIIVTQGWAWLGVELELESTESISMDASLELTGYMTGGELRIFFRCINAETFQIQWGEEVFDQDTTYAWDEENIDDDLNLNNFPRSTPSGTWLFVVHFEYDGWLFSYLQKASGNSGRAILEVASITITY